jgi:hypothetical protein
VNITETIGLKMVNVPFVDRTDFSVVENLVSYIKSYQKVCRQYHANYFPLLNSSGVGKTMLLRQLFSHEPKELSVIYLTFGKQSLPSISENVNAILALLNEKRNPNLNDEEFNAVGFDNALRFINACISVINEYKKHVVHLL